MAITTTKDQATISTTEFFLASDSTTATYQTSAVCLFVLLDLSNLQAGDTFVAKYYDKANSGTARTFLETTYSGVQSPAHKLIEVGVVTEGWEVSLTRTAGADRVIAWSLRTIA